MQKDIHVRSCIPAEDLPSGVYPVALYLFIRENSGPDRKLPISSLYTFLGPYCGGIKRTSIKKTVSRNLSSLILFDDQIHCETADGDEYDASEVSIRQVRYVWYGD